MVRFRTGEQVVQAIEEVFAAGSDRATVELTMPAGFHVDSLHETLEGFGLHVLGMRTKLSEAVRRFRVDGPLENRRGLVEVFGVILDFRQDLVDAKREARAISVPGAATPLTDDQEKYVAAQIDFQVS